MIKLKHAAGVLTSLGIAMSASSATSDELVIAMTGGAFADALEEHFFGPFTDETGVEIILVPSNPSEGVTSLRAQQQAGRVEFDIVLTNPELLVTHSDVVATVDCARLPNVAEFGLPGACNEQGVIRTLGATMVAFNEESFPDGGPQNWADFFNVDAFPGRRCLMGGSIENYSAYIAALLADGVEREALFPLDLDRAENKLRELLPHVGGYYTSYSMSQQLLRDGACDVSAIINGRALSLREEGFPLGVSWDQAIESVGIWSIAGGAPNEDAAYQFLDYWMLRPEAHLAFYRTFFYGTMHSEVVGLMNAADQEDYFGSDANFPLLVQPDWNYIGEHRSEIERRYAQLLAE